ncbi:MAG TPA: polysaccharide biosynthesis/export family protein [Longimicrobiales bacterium]|nr:polysaccharide biosynthesis/export family protein [Longimicrobiales bacterium]
MRRLPRLLLVALLALAPAAAAGQVLPGADQGSSVRTREDLESLLEEYERALASPAYSEAVKRSIRADAEQIRQRMELGDFRVGDRVVLYVQGEPNLPDTVAVEPGPSISLPLFGQISLAGVLRSELEAHLTKELSRFIRDPVVRANGLMRLAVIGAVVRPGFYTMPAEMLVGEALMVAGGPLPNSELDDVRIERGGEPLFEGELMQEAIRNGLTLDQLNLQAGDQIVVPQAAAGGWLGTAGLIAGALGSIATLVLILTR